MCDTYLYVAQLFSLNWTIHKRDRQKVNHMITLPPNYHFPDNSQSILREALICPQPQIAHGIASCVFLLLHVFTCLATQQVWWTDEPVLSGTFSLMLIFIPKQMSDFTVGAQHYPKVWTFTDIQEGPDL